MLFQLGHWQHIQLLKYIFNLSNSGELADLIFVFFDPIGQALCKRTLNLVEKLNDRHADHIRFYLSKADEAGHEADRQVSVYPQYQLLNIRHTHILYNWILTQEYLEKYGI